MAGEKTQLGVAQIPIRATLDDLDKDLTKAHKKVEGSMGKLWDKVGKLGGKVLLGGLAAVATGVMAIGGAAFAAGMQIDGAYDAIAIGTGKVGAELEGLQRDFDAVFKDVPSDAATVSNAMVELNRRLGLTGDALQDLTLPMARMTDMLGGDATTNAANFSRVMGDWGVPVENATVTLDKFFVANQQSGASVDALMTKVVQFGAPLRLMGFSLNDAIALFAKWEKEGVNAELVMGSLRIAAGKFADAGKPLRESLLATFDSIQNNTDATAALMLGMEVFGARAGPDMTAAIREGRFAFEDMLPALQNAEGAILSAAKATEDWPEKLARLKNTAAVYLAPIGLAMMDIATKAFEWAAPGLEKVAQVLSSTVAPAVTSFMDDLAGLFGDQKPVDPLMPYGDLSDYTDISKLELFVWQVERMWQRAQETGGQSLLDMVEGWTEKLLGWASSGDARDKFEPVGVWIGNLIVQGIAKALGVETTSDHVSEALLDMLMRATSNMIGGAVEIGDAIAMGIMRGMMESLGMEITPEWEQVFDMTFLERYKTARDYLKGELEGGPLDLQLPEPQWYWDMRQGGGSGSPKLNTSQSWQEMFSAAGAAQTGGLTVGSVEVIIQGNATREDVTEGVSLGIVRAARAQGIRE